MSPHFIPKAGDILRILVSTTDKNGLEKLARLTDRGAQIVSTGGTATVLKDTHRVPCIDVADVTGFPEMLNGRLKVLHPKIFGGLLAEQENHAHMQTIALHGIEPFHAVFINLYNFSEKQAISEIDVGGPSALRAAAKNGLIVVIDPADYDRVIDAMLETADGSIPPKLRLELICKVFDYTASYDRSIYEWFEGHFLEGTDPFASTPPSGH